MTADDVPAEIDPQDAFQVFSHELRLEILFALWDAPEYALAFAELQSAVDERDSGKFTYHLEQLTDHFVREVDGRYVLQYAGHRAVDAIQSGVFHTAPTIEPTPAPGTCPTCGATPNFAYADHLATVSCPDCDRKLVEYPFDPGGFQDRSLDAAIAAFDRRTRYKWRLASDGVCFVCAGRVDVRYAESAAPLDHHDRYETFFAADHPAVFHLSCRNCSFFSYLPVGIRLLDAPTALAHLALHGADLTDRYLWELPVLTDAERVTVASREPWRVRVDASSPAGRVAVGLGPDATVESVELRP